MVRAVHKRVVRKFATCSAARLQPSLWVWRRTCASRPPAACASFADILLMPKSISLNCGSRGSVLRLGGFSVEAREAPPPVTPHAAAAAVTHRPCVLLGRVLCCAASDNCPTAKQMASAPPLRAPAAGGCRWRCRCSQVCAARGWLLQRRRVSPPKSAQGGAGGKPCLLAILFPASGLHSMPSCGLWQDSLGWRCT